MDVSLVHFNVKIFLSHLLSVLPSKCRLKFSAHLTVLGDELYNICPPCFSRKKKKN